MQSQIIFLLPPGHNLTYRKYSILQNQMLTKEAEEYSLLLPYNISTLLSIEDKPEGLFYPKH